MKKTFAVLALILSVSSFARETVSFGYSGFEGWGRTYYSCDYVEAQTEKVLVMFGASQVDVRCSGGIDYGRYPMPVSITASFDLPVLSGTETAQVVKFRGDAFNPACGLNTAIVKNLLPKFSNITVLKKSDSCAFQSSNFSYEFSVVK